jgi:HNH endonuclease
MSGEKYFRSLWAETDTGEKLYPYTGVKGSKKGLYSVSFSGKSNEYQGISESALVEAVEADRFSERGTIRMLPLSAEPGSHRNGFAPTHYKGAPIVKVGQSGPRAIRKPVTVFPDELSSSTTYIEGLSRQVLVNAFERSSAARENCINHYGPICMACAIDFTIVYGAIGAGFIHVHHTKPLSSVATSYQVDPIKDLVPVCPNCHAMLHRREPPLSIEELRSLILEPHNPSFNGTPGGAR